MNQFFKSISGNIYNWVVNHLPFTYQDEIHKSSIAVTRVADGLRIITTHYDEGENFYEEIVVEVPQAEIERLIDS